MEALLAPEVAVSVGTISPEQFRNLVRTVSGREISTEQVRQFLSIFNEDLEKELTLTRRKFIEKHFGNRDQNQ